MTDEMRISFGSPLRVSVHTDVGRVRANNEDSHGFAWLADSTLFVIVADGMGGHEAGEVASGLAVQVLEEVVSRDVEADPRERLYHGLLEANEAILQEGRASGTRGMGTTAVAMLCKGWQAYVGLVGDSRLYHFRNGHLVWRTLDHTRVQMLIDQGEVPEAEAKNHVEAGMLTRALGHAKMADGRPLEPDVLADPLAMSERDALVICSDGLHDLLEDWEIGQVVAGREPGEAVAELVRIAVERGGHDNVTVAVVVAGERCGEYDPAGLPNHGEPVSGVSATVPPSSVDPSLAATPAQPAPPAAGTSPVAPAPAPVVPAPGPEAAPAAVAEPAPAAVETEPQPQAAPTPQPDAEPEAQADPPSEAPAPEDEAPPAVPAPPPAARPPASSRPVTLFVDDPAPAEAATVMPVPMAAPPAPAPGHGHAHAASDVTVATEIAPAQGRLPASQLATLTLPAPPEPSPRAAAAPPIAAQEAAPEAAPAPAPPPPSEGAAAPSPPKATKSASAPAPGQALAAAPPTAVEPRRSRIGLWIGLGLLAVLVIGGAAGLFAVVVLGAGATWFAL